MVGTSLSTSRERTSSNCREQTRCTWFGDTAPMLDEIEEFVTGVRGSFGADRVLTTIMFTDIVGSTQRAAMLGDGRWRNLLWTTTTPWCVTNSNGSAGSK